ncbi:sister chromatid cohesion protein PDS5 [Candidatus Latescibacterota bacterium]
MSKVYVIIISIFLLVVSGCSKTIDDRIEELDSDSARVRFNAATYLSYFGKDPDTVRKVTGLLESNNERLIFIAAQILGNSGDSTTVEPLGKLTVHPNHDIRDRAVQSLGLINTGQSADYVIKALEDSSAVVRKTAVKMIGIMNYSAGVADVVKMLDDISADIRAEAVHTLYTFRKNPKAGIVASYFEKPLDDENENVRYVAVQALDYRYPDSAKSVELLMKALDDKSKAVRAEAVNSLGKIGCKEAIPQFKKMHDLEHYNVQIAISEAIKQITGEDFPAFRAYLNK